MHTWYAKLKILFSGKYMGIRFIIATLIAHLLNEIFYAPIAFRGLMDLPNFIHHMTGSWIFMVSIELLFLPLSIKITKKLKILEKLDIYENEKSLSFFKLDSNYKAENNKYK